MRTLFITTASFLFTLAAYADGNMDLVSIGIPGASAHGDSDEVAVSADGRYVAFTSDAPDLVAGDLNGIDDIFVRDMVTGVTTRVSVSSAGVEADGPSGRPDISADGNIIVFESDATNLHGSPDLNGYTDVYQHNLALGNTSRVSITVSALETDGDSDNPVVSGDGMVIAFRSEATNLLNGISDTNGVADVFCTSFIGLQRVSVSSTGAEADNWSGQLFGIDINGDGMQILFASAATNLVAGDTNGWVDMFVRDQMTGAIERVSLSATGAEGDKACRSGTLSDDGNVVAFDSASTNLVSGDTNNAPDCFVLDRSTGVLTRISLAEDGTEGTSYSIMPFVSADGSVVCFQSLSPELDGGPVGSVGNVLDTFRYHVATGSLTQISVGSSGSGNDDSFNARPTGNGGLVAMASDASNFDPLDTNSSTDVFLVIPGGGDGGGTGISFCDSVDSIGCPCGNAGAAGEGCANGTGEGAIMSAAGFASASASSVVLSTSHLIPSQPGLYFQGNNTIAGGQGIHFGDGLRCVGGAVVRLQVRFAADDGSSATSIDLAGAGNVFAGDTKRYQLWYRDPNSSMCGALFNLSNGVEIVWGV